MRSYFNTDYQAIDASETDQTLGPAGNKGDLLERLVITVESAETSAVSIKDGSGSAIPIMADNTPVGVYSIEIGARSISGGWKVTTGAGATVVAIGRFT